MNRLILSFFLFGCHCKSQKLNHQLKVNCELEHLISISVAIAVKTIIITSGITVIVCEIQLVLPLLIKQNKKLVRETLCSSI